MSCYRARDKVTSTGLKFRDVFRQKTDSVCWRVCSVVSREVIESVAEIASRQDQVLFWYSRGGQKSRQGPSLTQTKDHPPTIGASGQQAPIRHGFCAEDQSQDALVLCLRSGSKVQPEGWQQKRRLTSWQLRSNLFASKLYVDLLQISS